MLATSLFGHWYELRYLGRPEQSVTGWEYFHGADLLILALAIAAAAVAVVPRLRQSWRAVGLTLVGTASAAIVYHQVAGTPRIHDAVRSRWAGYVALVAAALMLLAGVVELLRLGAPSAGTGGDGQRQPRSDQQRLTAAQSG
jgi:hypothetical protein